MADYASIWANIKTAASFVSSTGFIAYGIKEIRKRFQKPELLCSLRILNFSALPQGKATPDGRGGHLLTAFFSYRIEQKCEFTITNNSEYIAYKPLLLIGDNDTQVRWWPEPDYTLPIMPHQRIVQEISITTEILTQGVQHDFSDKRNLLLDEIKVQYQNSTNRRYILLFKPNENVPEKRNT